MKKINLILILLTMLLSGCKKGNQQFTLHGEIKNLKSDTILIFSQQSTTGELDTIIASKGRFSYSIPIDTLTLYSLLIGETEVPVFTDKGLQVTIEGDASDPSQLQISGGSTNDELNNFKISISGLKDSVAIINKADSFIRKHPFSRANIYLLDKYFVQKENPDYNMINSLIQSMSGELQDIVYIKELNELANEQEKIKIGKRAPSFNGKNTKDTYVSLTKYKDQYVLINFWASWCEACAQDNPDLKKAYKQFKKEKFAMIGISLDTDKKQWLEGIERDTLNWEQISDLKGWDNGIAQQFGIENLPTNILIGPDQTIIAKNLKGQNLINKLEEIFKQKTSTK